MFPVLLHHKTLRMDRDKDQVCGLEETFQSVNIVEDVLVRIRNTLYHNKSYVFEETLVYRYMQFTRMK